MIYLNQAGTSWPKPAVVQQAMTEAMAAPPETWSLRLEALHREVCRHFGVSDPSRMLLTPGATSALAVALADHPWERGDRVVISGLEHHALHRPAQQLAVAGVEVVVVPPSASSPVCLETLENELRRGKVRLVAMTAACNVTGELLPLEAITALARQYGALSLIDAAQIAGWLPIDAARFGADLFAFAGHKGPRGPWGIGGLYVAPHVSMASPRAVCELPQKGSATPCAPMAGPCDVGSINLSALAGLAAGLRSLTGPEEADRLQRARRMAARLADAVCTKNGVSLHGSMSPEARMPTVALTFRDRSPQEVAVALAARGVIASAGLQCAPLAHETLGTAPTGVLRLSVGASNDDDEITQAIEALTQVVDG